MKCNSGAHPLALIVFNLVLALLVGAGCTSERDQQRDNDTQCLDDVCEGDTDVLDSECDALDDECEDEGERVGCETDSHCEGGRYCYEGTCVGETYICARLNCVAEFGVCDPEARACVNAVTCSQPTDCVEGYRCLDSQCVTEAEACSVCTVDDECRYDSARMEITCVERPRGCTPGERRCTSPSVAVHCDETGQEFIETECGSAGCNTSIGRCNRDEGDACYNPIDVSDGYTATIEWKNYSASYSPTPDSGCAKGDAVYNVFGPDVSYKMTIEAGYTMQATITTPANYAALYVTTDCDALATHCLDVNHNIETSGGQFIQTVSYKNETGAPQEVFIIADSGFGVERGPATIEISQGELICAPGGARCNGDTREVCNSTGLSYVTDVFCPFGCNEDTAQCNGPTNDTCDGAYDIMAAGGTFTGNISDYTTSYNPGNNCSVRGASGRDAVFVVSANEGDMIRASMSPNFDAVLWAADSCTGTTVGTCLAGSDSGNPERIEFIAPATGDYYIIADAYSTSGNGQFTLDVNVLEPACTTPGEVLECLDANTMQYCRESGFPTTYRCQSTCTDGVCDEPKGDFCLDVIPLAPGEQYSGVFSALTNQFNPGTSSCITSSSDSQTGRDAIFAIDLAAGDVLTAELTATSATVGMYILDSCELGGNVAESCLYARPRSRTLEYFVPETRTYYLVVDSTSAALTENFTLSIDKRTGGVCQPGTGSCLDGTLTLCNAEGTEILASISCAYGCNGSSCGGPELANDTCPLAYDVPGNIRIQDSFERFEDDYSLLARACVGARTPGGEAIYRVSVEAGNVLRARVTHGSSTTTSHAVYIVEDCADINNTCVGGARGVGGVAETGYVAEEDSEVYVVVDSTSSSSSGVFTLDLATRPSECTPSTDSVCLEGNIARTCTEFGLFNETACLFGCVDGECTGPTNDTCEGALDANNGANYTASISHYTNKYDLGTSSCTGFSTSGPESTYYVDANPGDIIRVHYSGSWDLALWITRDCGTPSACLAGVDAGISNPEQLNYTVTQAGRYYVVADSYTSSPTGNFTVDITVTRANP